MMKNDLFSITLLLSFASGTLAHPRYAFRRIDSSPIAPATPASLPTLLSPSTFPSNSPVKTLSSLAPAPTQTPPFRNATTTTTTIAGNTTNYFTVWLPTVYIERTISTSQLSSVPPPAAYIPSSIPTIEFNDKSTALPPNSRPSSAPDNNGGGGGGGEGGQPGAIITTPSPLPNIPLIPKPTPPPTSRPLVVGASVFHPAASGAYTDDKGVTLHPGGPELIYTLNVPTTTTVTLALAAGGSQVIVNGKTTNVPWATPIAGPQVMYIPPVLTIEGVRVTATILPEARGQGVCGADTVQRFGYVLPDGQTLTTGGVVTVYGTMVSLAAGATALVVGASTTSFSLTETTLLPAAVATAVEAASRTGDGEEGPSRTGSAGDGDVEGPDRLAGGEEGAGWRIRGSLWMTLGLAGAMGVALWW